jgi:hypothetical protein
MAAAPKKKTVRKTPGNPPDSPWYSTKIANRKRKPLTAMVDDDVRELAEEQAKLQDRPLSHIISEAIREYAERRRQ